MPIKTSADIAAHGLDVHEHVREQLMGIADSHELRTLESFP